MTKVSKKPKTVEVTGTDESGKEVSEILTIPDKKYEGNLNRYDVVGDVMVAGCGAEDIDGQELGDIQKAGGELYMDAKSDYTKRFLSIGVIK